MSKPRPGSIPNHFWAAIVAAIAAFCAPGVTFLVARTYFHATRSCGAGSCDLAAASVAALSILPAAVIGFFQSLFLLKRRTGAHRWASQAIQKASVQGSGTGGLPYWPGMMIKVLAQQCSASRAEAFLCHSKAMNAVKSKGPKILPERAIRKHNQSALE